MMHVFCFVAAEQYQRFLAGYGSGHHGMTIAHDANVHTQPTLYECVIPWCKRFFSIYIFSFQDFCVYRSALKIPQLNKSKPYILVILCFENRNYLCNKLKTVEKVNNWKVIKMKRFFFKFVLPFFIANHFVVVKCYQWRMENSRVNVELIAYVAECMKNEFEIKTYEKPVLEDVTRFCLSKEFALLKPVIESKSNETVQLICHDADTVVISVQSGSELKANDAGFTAELYVVKVEESGDQLPSKMIHVVSGEKIEEKWDLIGFVFYITE